MLVLRSLSPTDSPFGTVDCMLSCECLKFTMGRMRIMLYTHNSAFIAWLADLVGRARRALNVTATGT